MGIKREINAKLMFKNSLVMIYSYAPHSLTPHSSEKGVSSQVDV